MRSLSLRAGIVCVLWTTLLVGQKLNQAPENWFNLDPKLDNVYGISTERAYNELLKGKKSQTVVVAVIDAGTDPLHEDLKDAIWINEDEIPGNGIDDDRNGYIDDIHGWNFIGGKDGDVDEDTYEATRIYAKFKGKYEQAVEAKLSPEEKKEWRIYKAAEVKYKEGLKLAETQSAEFKAMLTAYDKIAQKLLKNGKEPSFEDLRAYRTETQVDLIVLMQMSIKVAVHEPVAKFRKELQEGFDHYDKMIRYGYNTSFDSRVVIGDNYEDATERYYGNNHVLAANGDHGTHVAGIIGAIRGNNLGIKGVADNVKIMVLRVVPDGDERDKDISNAIRYAADNGAKVINMSFGKGFSYNKKVVDDAVKYAAEKDVLMVHAAGNDGSNIDYTNHFPTRIFENGNTIAENWLEVGASTWMSRKKLAASFSNYGHENVDLFAPGYDIYSTVPDSVKYKSFDGTSMAAPVVAGAAALIRSYYPELNALEVKNMLLLSVVKVKGRIYQPSESKRRKKVKFKRLCKTGGIVNVYQAIQLIEKQKSVKQKSVKQKNP